MADDQSSKNTSSIDDLVRELSKSSTNPVAPTSPLAPAPQAPRPSFPTPKPSISSLMTGSSPVAPSPKPTVPVTPPPVVSPSPKPLEMSRPQFNAPPKPFTQPLAGQAKPASPPVGGSAPVTPPPTAPGVKEYQSSIRTMNEDISRLKQGQKPTGINIPRKVEQVVPAPVAPVIPTPVPGSQFKVPSVNLGGTQKTGPLAQSKDISKPPMTPKIEPKPPIYVPQEGQKGGNHNMLFVGIGVVVLVAGFAYWFFMLRSSAPVVVEESPTPTPTATPVQNINNVFADATEIEPSVQINGGEFRKDSQQFNTPGLKAKLLEMIEGVGGKYPVEVGNVLGNDAIVLWYGQKEFFDDKGQLKIGTVPERRLVVINEIANTASASQALSSWESSMSEDLKLLVTTDKSIGFKGGKVAVDFMDNFYRGVGIRYKNFPYADISIDYAVIESSNGKSYLIITSSREAMYATIDKLSGF